MENNENVGATTPETQNTQAPEKDYKHEYEKQLMEIEKLKNAISKTNSENAEYKKKELAKMSDDEKKAREYEELVKANNEMAEKIKSMELKNEFLNEGFTAEEFGKLLEEKFSAKSIATLMKNKVEEAVKSAKAEFIKGSTPDTPMGKGTTNNAQDKTDFQKFQESQKQKTNRVEI